MPNGQVELQVLFNKFKVRHDVQLDRIIEQVAQSPSHGTAMPDIFKYPSGVEFKHLKFNKV